MSEDEQYKRFDALRMVLVDNNPYSKDFTAAQLAALGVTDLHVIDNYEQFSNVVAEKPVDIIAFDTADKTADDLNFIRTLRKQANTTAFTPLLALSQDTTKQDVHQIMDAGATELVAKPANVKHIFGRIQNMVDSPRSFVAAQVFKGPDRRRKQKAGMDDESRTNRALQLVTREEYLKGGISGPVSIMPDFSLKMKVNKITPDNLPQKAEDEFLFWALSDVAALEASQIMLGDGGSVSANLERICNACLSINARSKAYGYNLGCEVAEMLGDFCKTQYNKDEKSHLVVLEKHIQTLSIVYHHRMRGDGGEHGRQLVQDLKTLVKKYTQG